ncbi:YjaG family protein [Paraferrimonas sp. SM1919]|uniref:DUF416 family protein n=1 Tax=Paraferrimonas sp. SM1919 TaxID=2662263 RepID=UPI0013D05AEB|nr:YjaG family protein [Paraferrimonas sp. SM1919]
MSKSNGFFQRIKALPKQHKLIFAVALTQRMQPNYKLFCEIEQKDFLDQYNAALDKLWQKSVNPKLKINYQVTWERLDAITPEPEQYNSYVAFPARDAVVSLVAIFNALETVEAEDELINISKLSSSTVVNYISAAEQIEIPLEGLSDDFYEHPLMQDEQAFQQSILDWIEPIKNITQEVVQDLRKALKDHNVSNLGL